MTRDETIEILMVVQAAYPNYKPHDKTVTVNLWYEMLLDYSYQQVGAAVKLTSELTSVVLPQALAILLINFKCSLGMNR